MGQCSCIFHGYVKFSAGLNFHMTTTSGWWITNQTYRILWHLVQPQFFNSEVPNVTTCNTRMVATQETMDDPTFQEKVIWKETCPKLNFHWNWLNRPSNLGNVFFPFFSFLFHPFPVYRSPMNPSDKMWQALGIFVSGRATGWWFQLSPLKNQSLTWLITGWRENLQ